MRKLVIFILLVTVGSGLSIYSAGKYVHLKPIIKDMVDSLEIFILGMEKAENADAVAAALDKYSEATLKIAPKVKEMMKKYPELKNETNRPKELKPLMDKSDELAKKLIGLFGKISKYAKNPKVKAANERWQKAMASLDDEETKKEEE